MSRFALGALSLALLASMGAGCGSTRRLPSPFVLNRSDEVELVCFGSRARDANRVGASNPDQVLPLESCANGRGVKHALVTQSTRGEVAALDIDNSDVLDSELRVPGYTFLDVGPLPSALVVPRSLPGAGSQGPLWTYVASRGSRSVRAIATCRFLRGVACGPELALKGSLSGEAAGGVAERYVQRTELPLLGAPADMLIDPSGAALWVTLPDQGLLARIDLAVAASDDQAGADAVQTLAFAEEEPGIPRQPSYYELPVADGSDPGEPVPAEDVDLQACGKSELSTPPIKLPLAPRAQPQGGPQPTRMRLVETGERVDEQPVTQLFVVDRGQKVMHVLSLMGPEPAPVAALPLGATVRDFAATPAFRPDGPSEPERFLYAIDEDTGLMAFELTYAAGGPGLLPLAAPVVQRRFGSAQGMYRDRLFVNTLSSVPEALDVVDNRGRNGGECNEARRGNIDADVLHGVFVVVAGRDGRLAVLDVIEEDDCRCMATQTTRRVPTRRHAPRLISYGDGQASITNRAALGSAELPEGYAPIRSTPVSVPRDPWRQRAGTWDVLWESSITAVSDGFLDPREDQLVIHAPAGLDLCERGVRVIDRDGDGAPDDELRVAVASAPLVDPECPVPSTNTAQLLAVTEAYQDRLVVRLTGAEEGRISLSEEQLRRCYAESIGFEVRLHQRFMVRGPGLTIMHRVRAAQEPTQDGQGARCVLDDQSYDAKLDYIAVPGQLYADPFIAFPLSADAGQDDSFSITLSELPVAFSVGNLDSSSGRTDALPVRVRYFSQTNDLFVVDSASQGLRRYTFNPFEADDSRFR